MAQKINFVVAAILVLFHNGVNTQECEEPRMFNTDILFT